MMLMSMLDFVNIFFAGMLAGSEFVIHYGVRKPAETLDEYAQLQLRKALVLKLRILVPSFFVPTTILGIVLTFLNTGTAGFVFRCIAVAVLLVWVVIRVIGTVPINSATVDWQLSEPPRDWKEQVERAERFHIFGVWAAVLSFVFFLISVALEVSMH